MNQISIKKMVPKFNTDAISIGLPYRIIWNGTAYVGVFYIIDEDRLEFKYFDDETSRFVIILPTADIEIYPFSLGDIDVPTQELKKDKSPETTEDVKPNIEKFYIRHNLHAVDDKPLFIFENDRWLINKPVIDKYMKMKDILVRVNFGISSHALHSIDAYAVFPPECIEVNTDQTMLSCIDKSNKSGYNLKSIHIDSNLWQHIAYAYIEFVDKDWYEGEI